MANQQLHKWRWVIGAVTVLILTGGIIVTQWDKSEMAVEASQRLTVRIDETHPHGISDVASFAPAQQRVYGNIRSDYLSSAGVKAYLDFNR